MTEPRSGEGSPTQPIVVITGASAGIGRAIARRYAAGGRHLLLIARRPQPLEQLAGELRTNHPTIQVTTLAHDVTSPDITAALDAALAADGGYCDLLVNNAGIGLSGAFDGQPWPDVAHLLAINTMAPARLMHHVLPGMRARRQGGVINLASLGGFAPGPYQAAYYASRAFVLSLSEAVAAEMAWYGVRVTAVAPGPVSTRFHEKMAADNDLYRWLIPPISSETVARWATIAHKLGARVVVPGLINNVLALFLRLVPHGLSVPIQRWLFYPRNR